MELLYIFLSTCIFVVALYFIAKKRPAGNLPPGPRGFPIIGNLLDLGDKPHRSLAQLASAHGPIMALKLGRVTTIVISSASAAREVMQKHDLPLSSRTAPDAVRAHQHDRFSMVWLPATATWRHLRKICNSNIFAVHKLDSSQILREEKVGELVESVERSSRSGEAVEIGQAAFRTALNLLSNTVFSFDMAAGDSNVAREFKSVIEGIMEVGGNPNIADCFHFLRKLDPQGSRRKMEVHFGKVLRIFGDVIDQRVAKRLETSNNNDVLDVLLRVNREEGLDRAFIEHLLLDLFGAGTDTTSNTVEWAVAELLHHPEKLRAAQEELDRVIGRENKVKESDISDLPYLRAVVKETMRLHPTVPLLLPRKAEQDVEIFGFLVPKGAQILVNAWAIGRDPTTWEDPNSFVPERFVGSEVDVKGRDFGLIPFGAGRRICPGMPLAIRMVHLMLASLIHGFEWRLEDGVKPEEMNMEDKFGLTLSMARSIRAVPVSRSSH